MKIIDELDQSRMIKLWIDEIPYSYKKEKTQKLYYKANKSVKFYEGNITAEVKLNARHISNYAMISMKYLNEDIDGLIVEIVTDDTKEEMFDSEIWKGRKKYLGIHSEFVDGIINLINKYGDSKLPTGRVILMGGGYDEVSSSIIAFERVMDILFFVYKELGNSNIKKFNKKIIEKCSISYTYDEQEKRDEK